LAGQAVNSQVSTSTVPYASEMCYTKQVTDKITLSDQIDLTTLEAIDIMNLERQSQTTDHYIGFYPADGDNAYREVVTYVASENMYPDWYTPAIRTIITSDGISSEYNAQTPYISDWWKNSTTKATESGIYTYDQSSHTYSLLVMHTQSSGQSFEEVTTTVEKYGVLKSVAFYVPSDQEIIEYQNLGYYTSSEGSNIAVYNNDFLVTWDPGEHIIREYLFDGADTTSTTTSYYVWDAVVGAYLIDQSITYTKKELLTSTCAQTVTTTQYSNWSISCSLQPYSSGSNANSLIVDSKLVVAPNPVDNYLRVAVDIAEVGRVEIRSIDGRLLLARKHDFDSGVFEANVSAYQQGVYLITVTTTDGQAFNTKFIKS
jgi:hypothetical protein